MKSQLLIEEADLSLIENNILGEGKEKKYVIKGPFMEADIKNKNKRIYPNQILSPQVILYQEKIKSGRAVGELEHPSCFSESAMILTTDSWKYIKDISENEEVYTLNDLTGEIENENISEKIDEFYEGDMFSIKGRTIDTLVTPNHRFLLYDRNGKNVYLTALEIFNNRTKYSHYSFVKPDKDYMFAGRLIEAKNKNTLYQLHLSKTNGISLDKRFLKMEKVAFKGNVFCVRTKNSNFFCMDNNKMFVSGNSMEISMGNIAMKIEKLSWQGKHTVFGEANVLTTPKGMIVRSLMDGGVKFGVSSRGAGTLKEGVVQNDYRYVCNDIVFDPSARSAMVENIMEGKHEEWFLNESGRIDSRIIDDVQSGLKNYNGKSGAEAILEAFEKIMAFTTNNYRK